MASASGLDAQVGYAIETTFGTFVVPTNFIEFNSEEVERTDENVDSEALRPGKYVLGQDEWEKGRTGAEGPLEFEWPDRGAAPLTGLMLGSVVSSQPDDVGAPNVWQHVATFAPLDGQSASFQFGRPDATGTVQPWSYAGGKVTEWELSNEVDGFVTASLSLDFASEQYPTQAGAPALAVATFVASQRKLAWTGGSLKIGTDAVPVGSVSFSGSNAVRNDRYFIGSNTKYEQLEGGGLRGYEGSFDMDYGMAPAGVDLYEMFVNGELGSLTAEWQGRLIESTFHFGLKIEAPACRFNGDTPNVGGAEAISQSIPFDVLSNYTDSPITITITDNVAPTP